MSKSSKIRVAVLYGGQSSEHEVSLASASSVIENIDRTLFEVVPVGIDKQGSWFLGDDFFRKDLSSPMTSKTLCLQPEAERLIFNPNLIGRKYQSFQSHLVISQDDSGCLFDVVFPVIHGSLCEDGTMQGLLEILDLPYVGCGVLASSIGMNKDISKRIMMNADIPVLPFIVIKHSQWDTNQDHYMRLITEQLSFPVFVKPVNMGSSVGVHKVKHRKELTTAMTDAYQYDTKVIVEKGIDAIEIELAVLESECGSDPIVSIPGEIRHSSLHDFYSYESKYLDDHGAELLIPATICSELQDEAKKMAKKIFIGLDCEGMARIDLFVERGANRIYFNEVNTIPGFTQRSMYPKLMEASGVQYSDILTRLIRLAIDRHLRKGKLKREYVGQSA